jgi:hypothetical protein
MGGAGGAGTAGVVGGTFGGGGASLPTTGVPIMLLLLIALTMIVVGAVMARVAFGSPATAGEGTATETARGAFGS